MRKPGILICLLLFLFVLPCSCFSDDRYFNGDLSDGEIVVEDIPSRYVEEETGVDDTDVIVDRLDKIIKQLDKIIKIIKDLEE